MRKTINFYECKGFLNDKCLSVQYLQSLGKEKKIYVFRREFFDTKLERDFILLTKVLFLQYFL